jgi:cytochrome c-type biogenesis protein CcmH/NrfG
MNRRVLVVLAVLAGLGLAVVAGVWWLRRDRPAAPPVVDLTGADPEVASLVESAREKVLANPRSAASWGHLGMVLRAHGFADESSLCFQQAERLDPTEPRWPYYRGLTLVLTDPGEGLPCLRRAVELMGDSPVEPRFRLVEVLLEQGELDEAGHHLERALEHAPGHPRGQLLKARLAFARKDWKAVLATVEPCRNDVHARRQAHLLAAEAWQRLGKGPRAEKLLAQAGRLPPDISWSDPLVEEVDSLVVGVRARLVQASVLERQGRIDEAVRLLQEVVQEQPREVSAWVMLGQMHAQQKQPDLAEQALVQAVAVDPGSVEGWFQLGVARWAAGKKAEAAEAFRNATRLKPDRTRAHHFLGLCLKDSDRDGARQAFLAALRCQPDFGPARRELAELEAPAGNRNSSGE